MPVRLRRRVALALLALLAFAQVNVALAGCFMDRTSMATCEGCDPQVPDALDQVSNACVVHCTSDLQLTGPAQTALPAAIDVPLFLVARLEPRPPARSALDGPPVGPPPRRILLHSFLI